MYHTLNWLHNPDFAHESIRSYVPQPDSLTDKIILVTGAGDGIGKELALTYARCGATVLLLGKTQSKLEAVYDQIENENLPTPAILPMDLGKASFAQMNELAHLIQKEFGRLDGVVHNAGILGALTPLEMYDPITFEEVLKINLTAPFTLTQALFELLKASSAGSVIFTSSSVGAKVRAFWGAYALSKQGLEGVSDLFTQETHRHTTLRFNVINPGATRTNMRAHAFPGEDPNTLKTPADIMGAYVYLMTDHATGIKGQVINCQPK
ncbi:MAG: YciK family oxidoreductase [Moraxella sp.]|nr:YciK family oxidoreductase [Moraxella sp.]